MQCFFGTHALSPPPPSSLYPGQHHAYCKTLVALEDGQVVIKCHQHHQLLFKICYLYVTNVYSYVLMMQIKFVLYCIVLTSKCASWRQNCERYVISKMTNILGRLCLYDVSFPSYRRLCVFHNFDDLDL